MPRAWVLGGVAVIIVAVVAVLVLSGGGGGGGSGNPKLALARRACALISPSDFQAAIGPPRGAPTPFDVTSSCIFGYGAGNQIVSVEILKEGATPADFQMTEGTYRRDAPTADLPGVGGGAFSSTFRDTTSVVVLDTRRRIVFSLYSSAATPQQLIDLARRTVAGA